MRRNHTIRRRLLRLFSLTGAVMLMVGLLAVPGFAHIDTDADGRIDGDEAPIAAAVACAGGADPLGPDLSDHSNVTDGLIADTDGDGLLDGKEIEISTSPCNPDSDYDGLPDGYEFQISRTDPTNFDTDRDGLCDGGLASATSFPVLSGASDPLGNIANNCVQGNSALPSGVGGNAAPAGGALGTGEMDLGSNPRVKDTDGDGMIDGGFPPGSIYPGNVTVPVEAGERRNGLGFTPSHPFCGPATPNDPHCLLNPVQADTDGDLRSDGEEFRVAPLTNPLDVDTDDDTLSDGEEVKIYGTNPLVADTDLDGLDDGREVRQVRSNPLLADTDRDGLCDGGRKNPTDALPIGCDSSQSAVLADIGEVNEFGTDPLKPDTDADNLLDREELATSEGGRCTDNNVRAGTITPRRCNPLNNDTDGDSLGDGDEVKVHRCNPFRADADADTLLDPEEVQIGSSCVSFDTDEDGLSDRYETRESHTSPNDEDHDGDGFCDGDEELGQGTTNGVIGSTDPHKGDDPNPIAIPFVGSTVISILNGCEGAATPGGPGA